ncbi:SDR family oxidoreductase [Microbacterium sp. ARD31]|uniref:SDR family oxidoreductase n=1 Tax=Microbacterium sp. ARD31 TaxID=2962576 RepID=UPI002881A48A|nr:SDR family oxidoreductase [Microbacterium sp. ARD31]MDT0183963.1 SDR family oxidoreductase [Microbacterium sp. ARD31]
MSAALVTGGSRGIGRAVVKRLAESGFDVAFTYLQDSAAADAAVAEITSAGRRALPLRIDAHDLDAMTALVPHVADHLGSLDVLVNNVGVGEARPFAAIAPQEFVDNLTLNVVVPFVMMQEAAKVMTPGGRIVFISTSLTSMLLPMTALGTPAKLATEALTTIAAKEFGPLGITVNAIAAGATDTEGFRATSGHMREAMEGMSPFGRLGRPDEIAAAVAYLVSEDAEWVSGQTLRVNGALV